MGVVSDGCRELSRFSKKMAVLRKLVHCNYNFGK